MVILESTNKQGLKQGGVKMTTISMLSITVTHTVRIVTHKGVGYVRTRDISDVLGIKQPFEFTKDIREALGDEAVLSRDLTQEFRSGEDNARTPYVRVRTMIEVLDKHLYNHKTNGNTQEVIKLLQQYLNSSK